MKNAFFDRYQRRLRSGWRMLIYFSLVLALLASASSIMENLMPTRIIRSLVGFIVFPVIALGALWLGGRYLDHRKFKDYGFNLSRGWWLDFIFGIILGTLLSCLVFFLENAMGWVRIVDYFQNQRDGYIGMPFVIPLIMGFIFYVIVGFHEEILFRAYPITNLSEGLNRRNSTAKRALIGAYVLSSVVFGLVHSGNPNITYVGVVNLVLFGLFLGLPYVLLGELAIPIALHISWNFSQGLIFGFPVSGQHNDLSIIAIEQGGPQIWTGGGFGSEGGLIGTMALVVGCVSILLWLKISQRPRCLLAKIAEYNPSHLPPEPPQPIHSPNNDTVHFGLGKQNHYQGL